MIIETRVSLTVGFIAVGFSFLIFVLLAIFIFSFLVPSMFYAMLVIATLEMGTAIVTEAAISFLGLGTTITWERMQAMARDAIGSAPHITIFSGVAIAITVLGFNLPGDGLQGVFRSQVL